MTEQWKDVRGFGEKYQVSNNGKVKSKKTGKEIKPEVSQRGYLRARLYDGSKHNVKIHRLVAQAFVSNPDNLPQIDHINGDKKDNRVENLRWVDNVTNNNSFKNINGHYTRVAMLDEKGRVLNAFRSLHEASLFAKVSRYGIVAACRGYQRTSGGYFWKYIKE